MAKAISKTQVVRSFCLNCGAGPWRREWNDNLTGWCSPCDATQRLLDAIQAANTGPQADRLAWVTDQLEIALEIRAWELGRG